MDGESIAGSFALENEALLVVQASPRGSTFDDSVIEPEVRARFLRNLAAVTEVPGGKSVRQAAAAYGTAPATPSRLVMCVKVDGQAACVPMGVYQHDRAIHPELQRLMRKLYTQPLRPTMMAVYEDVRLKDLAKELSEREGKLVRTPTYKQVYAFLTSIGQEPEVAQSLTIQGKLPGESGRSPVGSCCPSG